MYYLFISIFSIFIIEHISIIWQNVFPLHLDFLIVGFQYKTENLLFPIFYYLNRVKYQIYSTKKIQN